MPFTLAHPAAVLPLKRYCPRRLSFNALVVGSVVPDAAYCFGPLHMEDLSHRFVGGFTFGLPVGLVMLLCIYGLRSKYINMLPNRLRQLLLPQTWQPPAPFLILLISLLLGVWTHLFWDSFTHPQGWMVEHLPLLQTRVATMHGHTLEVCQLVWYACSFGGVALVSFNYESRLHAAHPAAPPVARAAHWRNAVLVGMLVLPIEAVHHLIHGVIGIALVGACSLLLLIFMAWKIGSDIPAS